MPMTTISAYVERLPARMAEWKLGMADAASIPHMKESARTSTLRDWLREASPEREGAEVVSPARLKMLGVGVRYVQ